jgi:hypothetical protein
LSAKSSPLAAVFSMVTWTFYSKRIIRLLFS